MINISLAAYPGERHVNAAIKAIESANAGSLVEPLWGRIHAHHVQLVPQNFGILDEATCQSCHAVSSAKSGMMAGKPRTIP